MCLLVALLPAAVGAQSDQESPSGSRDTEAKGLFISGTAAYDDGRYQDALDYYERAYELSERPEMLFNIGQAAERTRMDARAIEAYRAFLEALPEHESRFMVKNRLAALREARQATDEQAQEAAVAREQQRAVDLDAAAQADTPATLEPVGPYGRRQGWQLRGGVGFTRLGDSRYDGEAIGFREWTATGGGVTLDLQLGYALRPGLYLASALVAETGASLDVSSPQPLFPNELGSLTLATLAGGMDWYPWLNRAWHVEGYLGLSALTATFERNGEEIALLSSGEGAGPVGLTVITGLGYDWRRSDSLSIGATLRGTLGHMRRDTEGHTVTSIALLVNLRYTIAPFVLRFQQTGG